jgi:hypothetical protein
VNVIREGAGVVGKSNRSEWDWIPC